jgi:DNA-binding transcriptional MerR regulator
MDDQLTIGEAARRSGVPAKTIRFYESEGLLPPPARTEAGYRLYRQNDVRRLRLIRRARVLGLALPEVRELVERAFASDCRTYAHQLLDLIGRQRDAIDRRIADLVALRAELDALEHQARTVAVAVASGQLVAECGCCPLVDGETGERADCHCGSPTFIDTEALDSAAPDSRQRSNVSMQSEADLLTTLACDITLRPADAPGIDDIRPAVRAVIREAGAVLIEFEPAAASVAAAFVDAERRCCARIGWELTATPVPRLRITATPDQLDLLVTAWQQGREARA